MANQNEEIADIASGAAHATSPTEVIGRNAERGTGQRRASVEELEQYERDGYVIFENRFAIEEIDTIKSEIPELISQRSERVVLEASAPIVRTVYGVHQISRVFAELARHPRILEPAKQMLGGDVYVYQTKLNTKTAFEGDVWPWHQDYIYWQREDSMPRPSALTVAVFLDEVTEFNGPLMLIPGSHHLGVLESDTYDGNPPGYESAPNWIPNLTAKMKYTIPKRTLARLARERGLVAPKGPTGSVLFFDCNIAHASAANLSHCERTVALITYNRVDNAPAESVLHRPDFLAARDVAPLVGGDDDVFRAARA